MFDCTAVLRNKNMHRFSQSSSSRSLEMFTVQLWPTGVITLQGAIMSPHLTSGLFFFPSPLASVATESAKTPTSHQDIYIRGTSTNFKRG